MKKPNRERMIYLSRIRYRDRCKQKEKHRQGLSKLEGVFRGSSSYGNKMRPIKLRKFPARQEYKRKAGRHA